VYEQTATIVDTGALSSSGARARVVNLYSENGQPVDLDVYAWAYSPQTLTEVAALVATVPFGQASDWFNPGLIEAPYSDSPYTKVTVERRGEAPDQVSPLAGTSEFLGPGTVTTLSIWQEELFDDQPDAWIEAIYAEHPTYEIPRASGDNALLLSRDHGLRTTDAPSFLHFGNGSGCLESPIGRTYPDIPNAQPLGSPLSLPTGPQALTLHEDPFGEIPTCTTKALGPAAPVNAAAGDRLIAFPHQLSGETEISLLVIPFD
jgi:hypothetical protein